MQSALVVAGFAISTKQEAGQPLQSPVAVVKNQDRRVGLRRALSLLGELDFRQKDVYLKGNYNSPDPFPATTHPDTLEEFVEYLREQRCAQIVLLERSGMGRTREIWERLGTVTLAQRLGVTLMALDDISPDEWRREDLPGSHWKRGVEVPRLLTQETCVVQVCNLKTHRFGGQFSASLKNSIGLIAKYSQQDSRHNYMAELHASAEQRSMIAEMNQIYKPFVVLMDASQVFISAGPETGDLAYPEVIVASRDRVALDATGVALLRLHGAQPPLSRGDVFQQEQLKRAIELNLGAKSVKEIEFLTSDDDGAKLAAQLTAILEHEKKPER